MKRIAGILLIAVMICMIFAGCGQPEDQETAAQALENLFTTIDLMDATVAELSAEMEAGHVTSEQLTQMYIDRIKAYDKKLKLNSIIEINPNAPEEARARDQERSEGKVRGALHGIPIVVKANCDIAGMATSAGSNALADMIAEEDAFVVKRLKEAGAVILAQTNLSEFAYSSTTSRSTLGGYVHNAYDVSKTPGGSSGGTAVAVTCNFAAAGVGTDTGGSIRNPSSFSNLYGIRPSKGLTSVSGVLPLATYKDTTGPMTRTAEDMALLLETMAGTDTKDDYTVEADADKLLGAGYTESLSAGALKGRRIGFLKSSFAYAESDEDASGDHVPDDKIKEMVAKAVGNLRKAGAEVVDISQYLSDEDIDKLAQGIKTETFEYDVNRYLDEKGDAAPYHTVKEIMDSGSDGVTYMNLDRNLAGYDALADSFEKTPNPYTKTADGYQRIPNYQKALDARERISAIMQEHDIDAVMYLNNFDVAGAEKSQTNNNKFNYAEYNVLFGPLLGLPEISLPMGFSVTDAEYRYELPLGMSVFADYGDELTLMQIAYAYEQQAGDVIRRSPASTPALEDASLNAFLDELIDRAYAVDDAKYEGKKEEGKFRLMLSACEKAMEVNRKDPYAVYEAAENLAKAYDRVTED